MVQILPARCSYHFSPLQGLRQVCDKLRPPLSGALRFAFYLQPLHLYHVLDGLCFKLLMLVVHLLPRYYLAYRLHEVGDVFLACSTGVL